MRGAKREDVQKVVDGNESCVLRVRRIYKRTDIDSCNSTEEGGEGNSRSPFLGRKGEINHTGEKERNVRYKNSTLKLPRGKRELPWSSLSNRQYKRFPHSFSWRVRSASGVHRGEWRSRTYRLHLVERWKERKVDERGGDTRLEIGKEGRVEKGRKRERIKFNPSEIR